MKIKDLLCYISDKLSNYSDSPRLDAEIIISYVLEIPRLKVITDNQDEISSNKLTKIKKLVERRIEGEPVAYLIGKKEFFGIGFRVNPSVLVPRPETELLVERAVEILKNLDPPARILDLGTGSGCIPVSLAIELDKLKISYEITAVDISEEALAVAKDNAIANNVNIEFLQSDWFSSIDSKYDLILSNPPYIAEGDKRVSRETHTEPKRALYSGKTGLDDVLKIIGNADKYINSPGTLLIEIGSDQAEQIKKHRPQIIVHKDLAGLDRFIELSFFTQDPEKLLKTDSQQM